jgi:hypothetical protein
MLEKLQVIYSRKRIFKKYIRFWFWIDLGSSIPFDAVLSEAFGVSGNS